jgi:hypothetical protein
VHLALLPMEDADENAVIVSALQRCAAIVVQEESGGRIRPDRR